MQCGSIVTEYSMWIYVYGKYKVATHLYITCITIQWILKSSYTIWKASRPQIQITKLWAQLYTMKCQALVKSHFNDYYHF